MENKIWLTNGKYVSTEDLVEIMFSDRGCAANIILKIRDDEIRVLATKALLSITQTSRVSKSNTSLAEDIFHDFTFGLFG